MRSWTSCCPGLWDLQHLNKKITRWWGVELLIIVPRIYNTRTKKKKTTMRSRIACRRVRDWPIALEQKNMSSSSSCPWGPLALEQKKYTSSLSLCAWLTYNIRTKEHELLVIMPMGAFSTWTKKIHKLLVMTRSQAPCHCVRDWPTTLEQKNTTMRSLVPMGTFSTWTKKKHDDEEPNSLLSCPWDLQH